MICGHKDGMLGNPKNAGSKLDHNRVTQFKQFDMHFQEKLGRMYRGAFEPMVRTIAIEHKKNIPQCSTLEFPGEVLS